MADKAFKDKTWGEVFFGTEEDRKRAKDVLKEMRPEGRYELPKLGIVPMKTESASGKADLEKQKKSSSVASTKDVEKAYQSVNRKHGTDRPVREVFRQVPIPKAKPDKPVEQKPAAPKAASDKSRVAGKMTNFERMKARQYEKEGYGGRSLTAEGAKAQVARERGYKISGLKLPTFGSKKSESKPSKPSKSFDGRFKSERAKKFAKMLQGRSK